MKTVRWQSLLGRCVPFVLSFLGVVAAGPAAADKSHLTITTLSARADVVSGGNVLVRIDVPRNAALSDVQVSLNGADVTSTFLPDGSGDALVGLVSGLQAGDNVLTAETKRTKPSLNARLAIRNSPLSGPVFSGPHQSPWICETLASGLGAAPAAGPCVAPTRYDWFYRATNNTFKPLPSGALPPH